MGLGKTIMTIALLLEDVLHIGEGKVERKIDSFVLLHIGEWKDFGFHLCGVSLERIGKDDIKMVRDAVVDFQDLAGAQSQGCTDPCLGVCRRSTMFICQLPCRQVYAIWRHFCTSTKAGH
ncbi:hypothetical protein O6P43_014573 [Quillaja saponaria]|uniref:SNF2 N-terminal domain-containing protein n=1 Tax=Quillaja saponaria TaxID=32244 RepID=A0AAD7LV41_QUISA|nr:hypothetical protein O6P43_014573 [Quillaja saponaria]